MASDTLSISKDLRAAGLTEQQADLLATHIASRPDDLATRQDLEVMKHELGLALADLDHKLTTESERLDHKIDQVAPQLLLKLGAGMVAGFGLTLTALGIGVGVLLSQPRIAPCSHSGISHVITQRCYVPEAPAPAKVAR